MASLVYLALYLFLHACTARPLMVWDKETITQQLQFSNKDVNTSVPQRLAAHDTNVVRPDDQKSSSVREAENIEGKKVKTLYSWKILHQAMGTELWKRTERSTLESPPCNAEENVRSKTNDTVEDVDAMDYAQPHRKPPIHNRGT